MEPDFEPTHPLDLMGDYSTADLSALFAESASRCPVRRLPEFGGLIVCAAEEVERVLLDNSFTSERRVDPRLADLSTRHRELQIRFKDHIARWPVFSEGDRHERMRLSIARGLRHVLTPDVVRAWERSAVRRIQALGGTSFDWLTEVARPTALDVLRSAVGEDAEELLALGRAVMHKLATPRLSLARVENALEAVASLQVWLSGKALSPRNEFESQLADLWFDDRYGPPSATAVLTQVVTGAYDPVVAAVGAIGEYLPEAVGEKLPISALREEVFRFAAPFRFTSRFATCALDVRGYELNVGDRVVLGLATANFDPSRYPGSLECRRRTGTDGSGCFSFGVGRHYCPGAGMARHAVTAVLKAVMTTGVTFRATMVEKEPGLLLLEYRCIEGTLESRETTTDGPADIRVARRLGRISAIG